jgi:hypothetical protein
MMMVLSAPQSCLKMLIPLHQPCQARELFWQRAETIATLSQTFLSYLPLRKAPFNYGAPTKTGSGKKQAARRERQGTTGDGKSNINGQRRELLQQYQKGCR